VTRSASILLGVSAGLDQGCRFLAKAALIGMVLVVTLQIVARYGLRAPPVWTEELARYLMVWGGLLGATLAFRRGADPVITSPVETDDSIVALGAKFAIAATTLIFIGPILYYSLFGPGFDFSRGFMMRSFARTSPGLGINLAFVAAAIPTCCAILLIHLAARLVGGPLPTNAGEYAPHQR
jgi:TRAP-type C4-dicarboxylate transport system permease small subunit